MTRKGPRTMSVDRLLAAHTNDVSPLLAYVRKTSVNAETMENADLARPFFARCRAKLAEGVVAAFEIGNSVDVPEYVLRACTTAGLEPPYVFELRSTITGVATHVGVRNFIAGNVIYVPQRLANVIDIADFVELTLVELPRATFLEFDRSEVPVAVNVTTGPFFEALRDTMEQYAVVTVGDRVQVPYTRFGQTRIFNLTVTDVNPRRVGGVYTRDVTVDVGYISKRSLAIARATVLVPSTLDSQVAYGRRVFDDRRLQTFARFANWYVGRNRDRGDEFDFLLFDVRSEAVRAQLTVDGRDKVCDLCQFELNEPPGFDTLDRTVATKTDDFPPLVGLVKHSAEQVAEYLLGDERLDEPAYLCSASASGMNSLEVLHAACYVDRLVNVMANRRRSEVFYYQRGLIDRIQVCGADKERVYVAFEAWPEDWLYSALLVNEARPYQPEDQYDDARPFIQRFFATLQDIAVYGPGRARRWAQHANQVITQRLAQVSANATIEALRVAVVAARDDVGEPGDAPPQGESDEEVDYDEDYDEEDQPILATVGENETLMQAETFLSPYEHIPVDAENELADDLRAAYNRFAVRTLNTIGIASYGVLSPLSAVTTVESLRQTVDLDVYDDRNLTLMVNGIVVGYFFEGSETFDVDEDEVETEIAYFVEDSNADGFEDMITIDYADANFLRFTIDRSRLPFQFMLNENEDLFEAWRDELRNEVRNYNSEASEGDRDARKQFYFSQIDTGPHRISNWFEVGLDDEFGETVKEITGAFITETYESVVVNNRSAYVSAATPSSMHFGFYVPRTNPNIEVRVYGVLVGVILQIMDGSRFYADATNFIGQQLHFDDMIELTGRGSGTWVGVHVEKLPFRDLMNPALRQFDGWRQELRNRLNSGLQDGSYFSDDAPPPPDIPPNAPLVNVRLTIQGEGPVLDEYLDESMTLLAVLRRPEYRTRIVGQRLTVDGGSDVVTFYAPLDFFVGGRTRPSIVNRTIGDLADTRVLRLIVN